VSAFVLSLQDALTHTRVDGVACFVGVDPSGAFGLLPGHARFMTSLVFGLAHFSLTDGTREYLAVPGALLYFVDNTLYLSTRRYFRDPDYARISDLLRNRLAAEERELAATHESLQRLEQEMLRRLWRLGRLPEEARP
jgi:F-type H+-transporting ATPase subunit epsilon